MIHSIQHVEKQDLGWLTRMMALDGDGCDKHRLGYQCTYWTACQGIGDRGWRPCWEAFVIIVLVVEEESRIR